MSTEPDTFPCCPCCDGIAKGDHVGHGGVIEKDGHDLPYSRNHDHPEIAATNRVSELEAALADRDATIARVRAEADWLNAHHDGSLVTSDYPLIARRIRAALDGGAS